MDIRVAQHAGFCFGVKRATQTVFDLLASGEEKVFTLGPLIHNASAVKTLEEKGVGVLQSLDEWTEGRVVIRSHGVGPEVYQKAEAMGIPLIDATCPDVKRIHRTVAEKYAEGYPIIILGKPDHPEVIGTNGWCGNTAVIISDASQLDGLALPDKACVVAQTTLMRQKWDAIIEPLKERISNLYIVDTICPTTTQRQCEAQALAENMDAMLVIGGKNSANTASLFQVCQKHCSQVYLIEGVSDIPWTALKNLQKIGIVAGASTPDWIIKEVYSKMSEQEKMGQLNEEEVKVQNAEPETVSEAAAAPEAAPETEEAAEKAKQDADASFMEDVEKTMVTIKNGQLIKGVVVQVTDDEVCVNIGYKSDGFIPRNELSVDNDVVPSEMVKVGDEIEVEILKVNDGEGNVLLSKKNVDQRKNWNELVTLFESETEVEGIGKEVVKGGLIANVMGIRAFIPASHLNTRYVEKIESYVGQPLRLRIIELDRNKRRVVASQKLVLLAEAEKKKKELWDKLVVGEKVKGIVRRLTDFGAFVDIGGLDGLIHIGDLSWGRVRHPSDVIHIGDEVEVLILALDTERERISLGYKQTLPKPWETAESKYIVGSVVEGKVVRIVTFGAFVELEPGLDGLVHISQIARERINKVEDVLQVGQMVSVKILDVDAQNKRISLSIKETLPEAPVSEAEAAPEEESHQEYYHQDEVHTVTIGDMIQQKMQEAAADENEN
ncbi:bifunctional 4-hydroxy-3-methylbut-2-enyl diphosphate reductase/30S ribosomal protein S1 [Gehongia tenuis]|uniref:4-hydroxy-3-methylbut-2-enyl diphosphate reductase n=1 Tax=Gehongia tenuis TaxID=2763655 RepID=A0A926D3Q9_9FIRM|nr:bifunctional 4-hydroxy-3-methylbut-2-enyl diphosphate reductase/30S ribosomal protein S1 [Gehongia tenuis]MBC8531203.1 bifunctional 4-hydroxy-3-methylbut-2-enyl diphosphate reductase/30S ribosomal protein S1 [Gehongia tenuis]